MESRGAVFNVEKLMVEEKVERFPGEQDHFPVACERLLRAG